MDKYIIFGLLIVLALLLIIYLNRNNNVYEKFTNTQLPNLQACPAGLNKYASESSLNCCTGPIIENKCTGKPVCTLSESAGNLPRCINWYEKYLKRMSKRYCPSDLKQFYEDGTKAKIGFCTDSPLNQKLQAPVRKDANKCNIHKSYDKNIRDPESCLVKRLMAKMVVPTDMSTKTAMVFVPNAPVVLQANYTDGLESKNCLDRATVDRALDVIAPGWRNNTQFRGTAYKKMQFCDDVKRKLRARAEDPNYVDPLAGLAFGETAVTRRQRRRWRFKWPRFRFPGINWRKLKFKKWKPRAYGICKK